jgi:hypothetical protein
VRIRRIPPVLACLLLVQARMDEMYVNGKRVLLPGALLGKPGDMGFCHPAIFH